MLLRALGYDEESHPGFIDRFVRHFDFHVSSRASGRRSVSSPPRGKRRSSRSTSGPVRASRPTSSRPRAYFENAFFNPKRYDLTRVGRYKLNRKLGLEMEQLERDLQIHLERPAADQGVLSGSEILAATSYMLHLAAGEPGTPSTRPARSSTASTTRTTLPTGASGRSVS